MRRIIRLFAKLKSLKLGVGFWLSVAWVALIVLLAIFANLLPLPNPDSALEAPSNLGPSLHHLLGTDNIGRDELSRLIFGSRVSLVVGFGSILLGVLLGGLTGILAGYYGKAVDFSLNSLAIIFLAFPQMILILALITFEGRSLLVITVAIGIVGSPLIFRVVRSATQSVASREYVAASKALGASTSRVLLKEIFPNVAMTLSAFVFIAVGVAILAEAGLSFLGLSVPPPTPTWGDMVNVASSELEQNSILWIWPSLALLFTVLSINVVADRLRMKFGIRESFL